MTIWLPFVVFTAALAVILGWCWLCDRLDGARAARSAADRPRVDVSNVRLLPPPAPARRRAS